MRGTCRTHAKDEKSKQNSTLKFETIGLSETLVITPKLQPGLNLHRHENF